MVNLVYGEDYTLNKDIYFQGTEKFLQRTIRKVDQTLAPAQAQAEVM